MKTHIIAALHFSNCLLQKNSQKYNRYVSGKKAKWFQMVYDQIKTAVFGTSDLVSMLYFLDNLNAASDSKSIQENVASSLFLHFFREPEKAALSHHVTSEKRNHGQEGELTTNYLVASYLFEPHANDDIQADAGAEITCFKQPAGMTAVHYSEVLCQKALRCGMVKNKSKLKRFSLKTCTLLFDIHCVLTGGHTSKLHFIAWCVMWHYR